MLTVTVWMLVCILLAAAVVALVAVPARRAGREVLTARGESVLETIVDAPRALVAREGRPPGRHAASESPPRPAGDPVSSRS